MNKARFSAAFLGMLLLILLLSACGDTQANIVGSWSGDDEITFYSDGTFTLDGESGKWAIVNNNILKLTFYGSVETFTIVDLSNTTLILKNESGKNAKLYKNERGS